MTLPKEIFGLPDNPNLMAQAIRVYLANQHQGSKKTLTRGEVNRTTAKVWKQKGTGRARHGSRKAPIFVGGGVAFGVNPISSPKLDMHKKMKRSALLGALSQKARDSEIIVLDSVKSFDGKTKTAAKILTSIAAYAQSPSDKLLLILPVIEAKCLASCRNLPGLTLTQAKRLHLLEILDSHKLIFVKDAIDTIKDHLFTKTPAKAKVTS